MAQSNNKFPRMPRVRSGWLKRMLVSFVIVLLAFTSYFTVPAESEGVVVRLGKFSHVVPAGLHFKLPVGLA